MPLCYNPLQPVADATSEEPMQDSLFDLQPFTVAPIWERRGGDCPVLGHKAAVHVHLASNMAVRHCLHPTANFPYYIVTSEGERIYAPNGRGFMNLNAAKQHVEQLWQDKQ